MQKKCISCGEYTINGHNYCLANLPGVRNACCGHGDREASYIQFNDGRIIRGFEYDEHASKSCSKYIKNIILKEKE